MGATKGQASQHLRALAGVSTQTLLVGFEQGGKNRQFWPTGFGDASSPRRTYDCHELKDFAGAAPQYLDCLYQPGLERKRHVHDPQLSFGGRRIHGRIDHRVDQGVLVLKDPKDGSLRNTCGLCKLFGSDCSAVFTH